MTPETLRCLAYGHGAAALAATVALAAAGLVHFRHAAGPRAAALLASLATALVTAAGLTGLALEGPYRSLVRQRLVAHAPQSAAMMQRMEHLAFGAVLLAWAALALVLAERLARAGAAGQSGGSRSELGRAIAIAFTCASALSLFACAAAVAAGRLRANAPVPSFSVLGVDAVPIAHAESRGARPVHTFPMDMRAGSGRLVSAARVTGPPPPTGTMRGFFCPCPPGGRPRRKAAS